MDVKRRSVSTADELDKLEAAIVEAAAATAARLARDLHGANALATLARLKFSQAGCDPLDLHRSLNFVEQLNQSFTYLASIEAARWLLGRHPDRTPFRLNLGTAPGSDISSADGTIVAEVFAATHPDSNDKLRNDLQRVRSVPATYKYVFYLSPVAAKVQADDVTIVRLDHACLRANIDAET